MSLSPWHRPTRRVIAVVLLATSGCTADTNGPARELDAAVQLGAEAGADAAHEAGARADASSDANQPGAVADAASSLPLEGGREASEDASALDAALLDA